MVMQHSIRIVLADDHVPLRAEIRADLESQGFAVCAEAGTASEAVEAALRERPALCLLDVRMPGDGVCAAFDISAALPSTRVVMLTVSGDPADVAASLRAGAAGYVHKDASAAELATILRAVLAGERRFPDVLSPAEAAAPRATDRAELMRDTG